MKGYFKCGKCRHSINLSTDSVCTNHNKLISDLDNQFLNEDSVSYDGTICQDNHFFILDSKLNEIDWIKNQIDKEDWTKGKIICPNNCGSKIGSFNFVQLLKCTCKKENLPPVHLIKSKVDFHCIDD